MIPFGEWLPDQPALGNPGATVATNVLPYANSYGPFPTLTAYSDALAAYCRGAISVKAYDGTVYNISGDAAELYSMADGAWSGVGDATYVCGTKDYWEFAKFDDNVIAVHWEAANATTRRPRTLALGGANFTVLVTTFHAKHVGTVGDFCVMGNTYTESGAVTNPLQLRWSALGNSADWVASQTTQAGAVTLQNGTQIQRITNGMPALVICETTVYRMEYIGPPTIWNLQEIDPGEGTYAPGSVVQMGAATFWLSDSGFRMSIDASPSVAIGDEKVDRTLFAELDGSNLHRVKGVADPTSGMVFWALPVTNNSDGLPNVIYVYNSRVGRWARIEQEVEMLYESGSSAYTLEGLDSVNASIDALTESLDSEVWRGGALSVGGFDSSHKLGYFSGAAMTGIVETAEFAPGQHRKIMLNSLRPVIDGGVTTIELDYRDRQQDSTMRGPSRTVRSSGLIKYRKAARYFRARATVSGNYTHAIGVTDIEAQAVGKR